MRERSLILDDPTSRDLARLHAIRRLWQRHGIILSDAEYDAIGHGIAVGLYKQIALGMHARQIYELVHRGRTLFAVWDARINAIVTFLPHQTWIERNFRGALRSRAQTAFKGAAT